MSRRTKTLKAVASLSARFTATTGKIEYALAGETNQWYVREHLTPVNEVPYSTSWRACSSPLPAVGLGDADVEGDVAHEVPGHHADLPEAGQVVFDVFVTGDIGHRYRLPRQD